MLKLLSVFEIDTGEMSETTGEDVTQKLIVSGFDVIHDDGGCDVMVNPRLGSNVHVRMFDQEVDMQTRCYITMCGDLYGISRMEAEEQMQDNLHILQDNYTVLGYTWSIK